jgi:small subunit ribosomal protein S2
MLGRFMPGTLTNPLLPYYIEPQLMLISDPQTDEQAILEATNAGIPVIGISNTDNITSKIDLIIPANNRGRKSLAAIYWLLAREILLQKGQLKANESMKYEIDDFETKITEEELEAESEKPALRFGRAPRQ